MLGESSTLSSLSSYSQGECEHKPRQRFIANNFKWATLAWWFWSPRYWWDFWLQIDLHDTGGDNDIWQWHWTYKHEHVLFCKPTKKKSLGKKINHSHVSLQLHGWLAIQLKLCRCCSVRHVCFLRRFHTVMPAAVNQTLTEDTPLQSAEMKCVLILFPQRAFILISNNKLY